MSERTPQKSFLFDCIYPLHSKMQTCANTVIQILHIILLHTVINMTESQMCIMLIKMTIIKIKWVKQEVLLPNTYQFYLLTAALGRIQDTGKTSHTFNWNVLADFSGISIRGMANQDTSRGPLMSMFHETWVLRITVLQKCSEISFTVSHYLLSFITSSLAHKNTTAYSDEH